MKKRALIAVLCLSLAACSGGAGSRGRSGISTAPGDKFAASYGLSKTTPDQLQSKRIIMTYPETGEKLDLVYFANGRYDMKALKKINYLFRDRHAHKVGVIDPELIDYLVDLRTRFNLPPTVTFEILNGYRTPATNAMMARNNKNVAIESLHVRGWAVDFRIPGVDNKAICEIAKTMQRGGVAYYPKSNHVHIDLGNIRTWHEK